MIEVPKLINKPFRASSYILDEDLKNAVELALALNQPLLLTGEPGTGKTKLAEFVAHELSGTAGSTFLPEPLVFNTKTSSRATDLFYSYDALGHFQASNIKNLDEGNLKTTADFIELQALGKAIAHTNPSQFGPSAKWFNNRISAQPKSSVVLIDEIDKAPRDFTNDILHEIEKLRFEIKELENTAVESAQGQRILIIMTSNSEKNLPDAFLRRCLFYHIAFPNADKLNKILKSQIREDGPLANNEEAINHMINAFNDLRDKSPRKKPATAEFVAWARILDNMNFVASSYTEAEQKIQQYMSVLVKTREDREELMKRSSDRIRI